MKKEISCQVLDETSQHIALTTKLVSEGVECCANEILKKYNVTTGQVFMLAAISRMESGQCTLKELEKNFCFSSTAVAGSICRMESKHFVESFVHPADKRIKCVRITEEGKNILEIARRELTNLEDEVLADFTEEEKELTKNMLRKAYKRVEILRNIK